MDLHNARKLKFNFKIVLLMLKTTLSIKYYRDFIKLHNHIILINVECVASNHLFSYFYHLKILKI